ERDQGHRDRAAPSFALDDELHRGPHSRALERGLEIVEVLDPRVADAHDDVAQVETPEAVALEALESRARRGRVVAHVLHDHSLDVEPGRHVVAERRDPDAGTDGRAVLDELRDEGGDGVDRDREPYTRESPTRAVDLAVDSDQPPAGVEK